MASFDRAQAVRSHRRGGPRRRSAVTPWLITALVAVLVGGGAAAGYTYFVKDACSGSATATIVVTPSIESIMSQLGKDWEQTSPSVDGACGSVQVVAKESGVMAAALSTEWDSSTNGSPPDVWVPDSSAWVRKASASAVAERIMPERQPSLARTPTVIAMPKPLAEAAAMTDKALTWQQIISRLNASGGWSAYQHAEWGSFKIGLSDPQASTAGLLALMAISDTDDDGEVTPQEQTALLALKKVIALKATSTAEIFDGIRGAAGKDPVGGLTYVSAFPALERDVLEYNLNHPEVPLVAVYPQNGTAEADYPYLILDGPWVSPEHKAVAAEFLRYVRGQQGRTAFLNAGFRDGNRAPGPDLTPSNGVNDKITALPRAVLLPESVQHAAASWTAVTRPTNVLFVFDTSGSMAEQVRGTGKTRLQLTQQAALGALNLLDDTARVGIWDFSTPAGSKDKDYRVLLPLARLDSSGNGNGENHRVDVTSAINSLEPGGNTGLYNTVWAACQEVHSHFQTDAANFVVLLTDGADDNNVVGGLSLDSLVKNLRGTCGGEQPVQVITVGIGVSTTSNILRQISAATGAQTFSSPKAFDLNQVVLSFLFD